MRIVLDARTATNHFPGIGRYVYNLAQAMIPQLTSREKLILLHDPNQQTRWDLNRLAGPQVEVIDVAISPFSIKQQWQIPAVLKKLHATLYHSPYYLMPYWPGIPTVLMVHDLIPLRYPQYSSLRARLLFRWTTALALRAASHTLVNSKATQQELLDYYKVDPLTVTPTLLAADPVYFPQNPERVADLRVRLGLSKPYVLYLGSNKPHKNLVRLVEAWAQIQPQAYSLVIAGVWLDRYPAAREVAAKLGVNQTIKFVGSVPEHDLPALYSGASLFVFPSEVEGFGLPVLEAMACAVPVVCANASSLPEIAGTAARLFDPLDVNALASAIDTLLNDETQRWELGQQSLQQAKKFGWQQTAEQTIAVYRNTSAG